MKLFGNKKRRTPPARQRSADMRATPTEQPRAAAERRSAAARPGAPERRSRPAPEARQSDKQGRGFLIMAIVALAGVMLMCILLIRYSGKVVMPQRISIGSTAASGETPGSSTVIDEELSVEELTSTYDAQRINFLIAGVNERNETNTLLLAGIDLESGELSCVSVLRETYISGNYEIPMLNQVYGAAGAGARGAEALKEKFKEMFGFWVDYYLILNAEALEKAVDLAGGVQFHVPEDMDYSEAVLSPGMQTLNGGQAVGIFRFRKDYNEVDTASTEVQREFLVALLEQSLEGKTAEELNANLRELLPLVNTDLSLGNLNWLAQFLRDAKFDDMYHKALLGDAITEDGVALYELDREDTLDVMNIHFNPTGKDLTEYDVNLRQQSGGAGEGTVESFWWQNQSDDSSEEPTEDDPTEDDPTDDDPTEEDPSGGASDPDPTEQTDPTEPSDPPTEPPTEAPTDTEAPPEE